MLDSKIHLPAAIVLAICIGGVVALVLTGHTDKIAAVASGVGVLAAAVMPQLLTAEDKKEDPK